MSELHPSITKVLTAFKLRPAVVRNITRCEGGLSGAAAWKIDTDAASYCLKLMTADFSVNRLQAIHHAVNDRRRRGMHTLAGYLPAATGETYAQVNHCLWELQTWVGGLPPAVPFTAPQKKAMFEAVAQFHSLQETPPPTKDVSPGIQTRIQLCERWRLKTIKDQLPSFFHFGQPQWKPALEQLLDSFVQYHSQLGTLLLAHQHQPYLLEDCIADPRPDNFRFDGDQLTGLFDLGSMRWDNIALDVSRLASEVSDEGVVDWKFAFQAMQPLRPLTPSEERLAIVFDVANILLTGLNWVQWLVVEEIRFASDNLVHARLSHLIARLAKIDKHPAWKL